MRDEESNQASDLATAGTVECVSAPSASGAILSPDERYRYRLWRIWDDLAPMMVWVMLNPSTADASQDDPTIRKCIGFAKRHHHGGIIVVNLFAYRSTDAKQLRYVSSPIGPENDAHIRWAVTAPLLCTVVAGWGRPFWVGIRDRATSVKVNIRSVRRTIHCFRNSNGTPWHPLYLPYDSPLEELR